MFRDYIRNPIDPVPMEYIRTLSRLNNEPDYSLTILGIALLKERIEDYKGITGTYTNYNILGTATSELIMNENDLKDVPMLCYYTYSTGSEEAREFLQSHNYVIIEKIGAFLKDKAGIECIAVRHKEKNIAAIFINSRDIKFYHLLISFVSLLFPNLFKDKPLKEKDYNIVKSLSKPDKDAFIENIQKALAPYTIEFRKLMLTELLKAMHDTKVCSALSDVQNQRNTIEHYKRQYADAIKTLRDMIVIYEGLKATEAYDEEENEFVEYLSTNKALHNVKINGSRISFTVATLLNNYNEDAWTAFSNAGYIYDGDYRQNELLPAFKVRDNRKLLLDNIFSESPEFAIKICSNYALDLSSCDISSERTYDYIAADPLFKSYIPNPHFKNFSCFGAFGDKIMDALYKRKYIVAVEYCCASAASVNLEETEQNFRPFLGWLLTSREAVLRRKDGVDMTPEEALVYLIDKEKANETN